MAYKFSTGFEREFLNIGERKYDCIKCLEPITNPICHSCLGTEIVNWLSFYPSVKRKILSKLKNYIKEVNNSAEGNTNCTCCHKNRSALCPYCFTEGVFNLLKRNRVNKMILMDFLSTFNFDLKHEGYIKEAIKEGLY